MLYNDNSAFVKLFCISYTGFFLIRDTNISIKRCLLVGVFTVSQILNLLDLDSKRIWEILLNLSTFYPAEMVGYCPVVSGSQLKHLFSKVKSCLKAEAAVFSCHFLHYILVVRRVNNNSHIFIVFCCSPYHCRPAYVNILNSLLQQAALCNSIFKCVEIYHHHIYRQYAMLLHLFYMLSLVSLPEYASVDFRMKCLKSAVQHLRETGIV